jgi:hypothetical protein
MANEAVETARAEDGRLAAPEEAEAIFVVGVSRSGTTLMQRVLETSPRIAIAGENHYMGHLLAREGSRHYFRKLGDLRDDATIHRLVTFIYSGEYARRSRFRQPSYFWRWLAKNVSADELERVLLRGERSERGVFTGLLRSYANATGREIIGEKSPPHLWHVETLLEWFPQGRVIHMVRDPRAVYVSEVRRRRDRPKKPYSWIMWIPKALQAVLLVQTTLVWRAAERRHRHLAQELGGRYTAVRFEDLVEHPDSELPRIFRFLGVDLPPNVTEVSVVSQGFRLGDAGLDSGAATRWREQIHPFAQGWLRFFLRGPMGRFGYR